MPTKIEHTDIRTGEKRTIDEQELVPPGYGGAHPVIVQTNTHTGAYLVEVGKIDGRYRVRVRERKGEGDELLHDIDLDQELRELE